MKVGVPLSAVMLPCSWFILTKVIFKVNFETSSETRDLLSTMKNELGELQGPELKVLIVFFLTALAWMFRTVLDNYSLLSGLSDAGIAMISALFLFLLVNSNLIPVTGIERLEIAVTCPISCPRTAANSSSLDR